MGKRGGLLTAPDQKNHHNHHSFSKIVILWQILFLPKPGIRILDSQFLWDGWKPMVSSQRIFDGNSKRNRSLRESPVTD
jgi:hypothetical protein